MYLLISYNTHLFRSRCHSHPKTYLTLSILKPNAKLEIDIVWDFECASTTYVYRIYIYIPQGRANSPLFALNPTFFRFSVHPGHIALIPEEYQGFKALRYTIY